MHVLKNAVLALLFAATVAGAVVLVSRIPGGLAPLWALAAGVGWSYGLALAGVTACFYLLDWVRFGSLLRILGFQLRLPVGLELCSVSYFVSSLTPTADLHLPAMIYVLSRHGADPGKAGAASITKSIYQVTWICLVALVSLAFSDVHLPRAAAASLVVAAVPLAFIVAGFLLVIAFPQRAQRLFAPRPGRRPIVARVAAGLHSAAGALAALGRSTERLHLVCHAASIAFIAAYVTIGWILCQALGLELSPARAIPVFSASLMVSYLAPVPGSIGVTEIVTAYLLDPALPARALVVAIMLRVLCWYSACIPGAVCLAVEFVRARTTRPSGI